MHADKYFTFIEFQMKRFRIRTELTIWTSDSSRLDFISILARGIWEFLYCRMVQHHKDNQTKSGIYWPISEPVQMVYNFKIIP